MPGDGLGVAAGGRQCGLELGVGLRDRAHVAGRGRDAAPERAPPGGHVDHLAEAGEPVAREEQQQEGELVRGLRAAASPRRSARARPIAASANDSSYQCTRQWISSGGRVSWKSSRWSVGRPPARSSSGSRQPVPLGNLDGSVAELRQRHEQVDVGCLARADVAVDGLGERRALQRDDRMPRRTEVGREALREAVIEQPALAGAHPRGPDTSRRRARGGRARGHRAAARPGSKRGACAASMSSSASKSTSAASRRTASDTLRRRVGREAHECHRHVPLDHAGSLISTR